MRKPDKALFEEYFAIESSQPALVYYDDVQRHLQEVDVANIDRASLRRVRTAVELADQAYKAMLDASRETAAYKWAMSQPGYVRAVRHLVKSKRAARASSSDGPTWVDAVMASLESSESRDVVLSRLRLNLRWSLKDNWRSRFFHALHELLYSDGAHNLLLLAKNGPKAFASLSKAIDDALPHWETYGRERDGPIADGLLRIKHHMERFRLDNLPVQRNTQHKAAHLYVYRLWQNNVRVYGVPKPEAIAELMTLDGVEHQFDERTIERLCARFKAAGFAATRAKYAVAKNIEHIDSPVTTNKG